LVEPTIISTLFSYSPELRSLSGNIYQHPEGKFEERYAHDLLTAFLDKEDFKVQKDYKSLSGGTEFRAEYTSAEYDPSLHPTIAVICEYDALPEIGHACGHNLIAESGIATGLAVRDVLKNNPEVQGQIVVMSTPGEEDGGGKCYLLARSAFADIDFAMMVHPFANNDLKPVILGADACNIHFHNSDNASSLTCRPMDAAVQLYQQIALFRSKFQVDWKVHGVVNPLPEKESPGPGLMSLEKSTHSWYMVRAVSQKDFHHLQRKLEEFAEAAATSTGCRLDFQWVEEMEVYTGMVHNSTMAKVYREYSEKEGVVYPDSAKPFYGSTDMGNVSLAVPSITRASRWEKK
ncbi:hypothetical protein RvY_12124-2, partial [Ramazzottius varieornatus]